MSSKHFNLDVRGRDIKHLAQAITDEEIPSFLRQVVIPTEKMKGLVSARLLPACFLLLEKVSLHRRLRVFYHKGLKCSHEDCPRIGTYIVQAVDYKGNTHIDIFDKNFMLMNVDHIHPKSRGGTYDLHNMQPMCEHHNLEKGSTIQKK